MGRKHGREARYRAEQLENRTLLNAGTLDSTFGTGGITKTPGHEIASIALQGDGRIVAVGNFTDATMGDSIAVGRYMPDGTLDPSFGQGGIETFNFNSLLQDGWEKASNVQIQPDGKILVLGTEGWSSGQGDYTNFQAGIRLLRLNPDGSVDLTFNHSGMVMFEEPFDPTLYTDTSASSADVAIQPDGKIVFAGHIIQNLWTFAFSSQGRNEAVVGRVNPDGSPDPSFAGGGYEKIGSGSDPSDPAGVVVRPGGKIDVALNEDRTVEFLPFPGPVEVLQLNGDGSVDSSWASNGRSIFDSDEMSTITSMTLSGNQLVLSGYLSIDPNTWAWVQRINSDGTLDNAFGGSGRKVFEWSGNSTANAVAIQVDGLPVAIGTTQVQSGTDWGVTRLDARSGPAVFDPTWGNGGLTVSDPSGNHTSTLSAIAIQPDGSIIVAGSAGGQWALARLLVAYPYHGTPATLPATIQAEDFDAGVDGGSFHAPMPQNLPQYRYSTIGVEPTTDTGGGYDVGYITNGEWLNYAISSFEDNTYTLSERVANAYSGGTFHVEIDGQNVTGSVSIPNTGGFQNWTTISQGPIHITKGVHVLKLYFQTTTNIYAGNINWLRLDSVETPFSLAAPPNLPARLEAENFDFGGEGLAYHDSFFTNQGGQYRDTGVDVETCTDTGGGYDVGFAVAGEWLKYTVNVTTAATYDVHFRVASGGQGGTFHLEVDGNNVTGPMSVPDTLGWQTWTTLNKTGVPLTVGTHVLRLVLDSNGPTAYVANFNWISFTASFDQTPPTAGLKTELITSGASTGLFQVTYKDNVAVSTASLGGGNIVVRGPNSFQENALLFSTSPSADAQQIVAIYRVWPPNQWTAAYNGTYTISLLANQVADTSNNYAPAQTLGTLQVNIPQIRGNVYDDANANGTRDAGEPGLAGQQLYVDLNNDGALQPDEPSVRTDANGSYDFVTLAPGSYTVRVVVPLAHRQTAPAGGAYAVTVAAGQISAGNDFGLTTRGVTHFSVTGPQSLIAGDVIGLTVTALDANGSPVPGYTGTVHFSSTDRQAVLPMDYTFTAADAGTHTFQGVGVRTAGRTQLGVSEVGTPSILGGLSAVVAPAAAVVLGVGGGPPTGVTAAGTSFGIAVSAWDAYGNIATGYRGTIHLSDTSGGATLPPDYTFTATDAGYHVFSNAISLRTAGWNRISLTDTASASPAGEYQVFITPAALDHFSVAAPATAVAGTPVNFTVTPQDAFNNTEPTYAGTIHVTASGSGTQGAALPTDYKFVPATDLGRHVFTLTFSNAGQATLMVADTAVSAVTGSATTTVIAPVPPAVTEAQYVYQSSPHTLVFTFTKNVSTSLTLSAIRVQNLTTGASVTPSSISYDPASNTATIRFNGNLADGNYQASLLAAQVADVAGTHLAADYTFRFFFLNGDVNHDGSVNFNDLLQLAQHFGQGNANWAQGDLNYDGTVGFSDLLILAQNYGHSLPAAAASIPTVDAAGDPLAFRIRSRRSMLSPAIEK